MQLLRAVPRRLPASEIVILHLSDIHFRKGRSADIHDEDRDVRNELENDLRRLCPRLSPVNAILVSGDIAFSGLQDEYKLARSWLTRLGDLVGCGNILVTPGNHDVYRDTAETARPIHQRILDLPSVEAQCEELTNCLRDATEGMQLFAGLDEYNNFAQNYNCRVTPDNPYWERSFPFSDGTSLCIRGITSTILSSKHDDDDPNANNLLYGGGQRTLLRTAGVFPAVVGHHPPSWVLDGDLASRAYTERAVLQIFGHEHNQWIDPGDHCVRIYAGAVHPSRAESRWVPRYNVLGLSKRGRDQVDINLFPRKWTPDHDGGRFMPDFDPDGNEFQNRRVRLTAV